MCGMCLQHHNSSLLSHGLIWPSPSVDGTISTCTTLRQYMVFLSLSEMKISFREKINTDDMLEMDHT